MMQDHPFGYTYSPEFPDLLEKSGGSLLVSTYQAGKLISIRPRNGRLSTLMRTFAGCTGIAVRDDRVAVATQNMIWFLTRGTTSQLEVEGTPCYFPRRAHVTGNIKTREIAWGGEGELWIANTFFSCLCVLDDVHSFSPRWRPPFVSDLVPEDRCHLNGMALLDGVPRYATALGATDEAEGWRTNKASGGVLLDVLSGAVAIENLSMPHSPRLYQGSLYLAESGTGRLLRVSPSTGATEIVTELPGFTRGLAIHHGVAFVGLSRIRETAVFGGLEVSQRVPQLKCGVWAVDLHSGTTRAVLEFHSGVEELFDVVWLPHVFPHFVGVQKETMDTCFVIP
jgi:uncharacterized protein (TIGR03032 family)